MSQTTAADDRKRQFEDALLARMSEMPYANITVSHLIKTVGVTRKTFYLHFANKDACLYSLMDRLILDLAVQFSRQTIDSPQMYITHFTHWREHSLFLKCVLRDNLFNPFLSRIIHHVKSEEHEALQLLYLPLNNHPFNHNPLIFFSAGYLAVLLSWANSDFETPVETLAEELYRLLHTPLFPT